MSTRSATIVRQRTYTSENDYTYDELFRFYRHCDGYPEGHGMDMARAFGAAEAEGTADPDRWIAHGLNNRNWCQWCFARLFAMDCDLEVEPRDCQHWDIAYLYVVTGDGEQYGGKHNIDQLPVTIAVYDARKIRPWKEDYTDNPEWSYEALMGFDPIYEGSPAGFALKFGEGADDEG